MATTVTEAPRVEDPGTEVPPPSDAAVETSSDPLLVELGALPLPVVLLLRASVAHHASGLRHWAGMPPEHAGRAPELLRAAEGAQRILERKIREAGYTIHPSTGA